MRSAYPAVFLCALACASVPSSARLSSVGSEPLKASVPASASSASSVRGTLLTGSWATEYFAGETLYDVLRRRAPLYLHPRPNPSAEITSRNDPIAVYIDGAYSGSVDVLQLIPAYDVKSVDRISASDAAIRFGPKHTSGVILVKLAHD